MDREQYILKLEQQSKYCDCPSLKILRTQFEKVSDLERECDLLKAQLTSGPITTGEANRLSREYIVRERFFEASSGRYMHFLLCFLEAGKVIIKLNSPGEEQRDIFYREAFEMLKQKGREPPILTLHCNACLQQIWVLPQPEILS